MTVRGFKAVYTVDEIFEKQARKVVRQRKLREKKEAFVDFCDRNKEWLIPLVPIVIGGVGFTVKATCKHINLNKEKNVKELFCYDRSLGHYWALRRRLTNAEWVEIDKRHADGERLADILSEFKVFK